MKLEIDRQGGECMEHEIDVIPIYFDYILEKKYPVNILVGGRNSGKSFFLEQLAAMNTHNTKNYKLLVVEDVETNIGAGVKDGIESRIEEFGIHQYYSTTKQPPEIRHNATGSSVIFKGYQTEKQQKQVKSLNEVTACWFEESEKITYEQFKALRMQLRGGDQLDRQLFLSLNPINEEGFICQYFFQTEPDEVYERFPDGRPKVFVKNIEVDITIDGEDMIEVIPCMIVVTTHWDNPYLTPQQRADIEEYKYSNPNLYAMLAEGKFVKGGGSFFPEFERHIHVVEPFALPESWRRYYVNDYGLDKLAGYWIALDDGGKAYVYKELWESDLVISDAATKINEYTSESIHQRYAPPDLWNRRQETGKSAFEIFGENGVWFDKTDRVSENGCLSFKEWLKPYEDEQGIKTANVQIFSNCVNLIKSMVAIQTDPKRPGLYDKDPHIWTHSIDAMIYFFGGRPSPYRPKPSQESNKLITKIKPKKKIIY